MHDVRIDHLGFANELAKHFAEPLKDQLKLAMAGKSADRATGDSFEAVLSESTSCTVDAGKFVKLFEKGEISRAQFIACISVKKDAALDVLSRDELARISIDREPIVSLRISRIKGYVPTLADSIRSLGQAIVKKETGGVGDAVTRGN